MFSAAQSPGRAEEEIPQDLLPHRRGSHEGEARHSIGCAQEQRTREISERVHGNDDQV